MPETPAIRCDVGDDGTALVTIDRPERRNALSRDAWVGLEDVVRGLRANPAVRGLIVTGAGDRAFASGADVAELVERPPSVALDGLVQGILDELEEVPFPTVAAINGHALGGGWELALACDLRVAVSSARLGFPEVGLGILPGAGGTLRLVQHVGVGRAKEWILTGRLIDAEEAHTHGLVNRLVGPNEALDAARSLMRELVAQPATSIRLAKLLLNAAARGDASPELERLAYTLTFHEPDRTARMERFLQRSQRTDD